MSSKPNQQRLKHAIAKPPSTRRLYGGGTACRNHWAKRTWWSEHNSIMLVLDGITQTHAKRESGLDALHPLWNTDSIFYGLSSARQRWSKPERKARCREQKRAGNAEARRRSHTAQLPHCAARIKPARSTAQHLATILGDLKRLLRVTRPGAQNSSMQLTGGTPRSHIGRSDASSTGRSSIVGKE